MAGQAYEEGVLRIFQKDPRYNPDAYYFVSQALSFTQNQFEGRHASGQELLEGIRRYALRLFGPSALRTLNGWGIRRCEDFGEIVFNLVEAGLVGANEQDRREDFARGYDFADAFPEPVVSKSLLMVLCHLLFDNEQLVDLDKRFLDSGLMDPEWLKAVRLNPFISTASPTLNQMAVFHALLEETLESASEARFPDVLSAFEAFARQACGWETKPDMMMHDFLHQRKDDPPDRASAKAVPFERVH
jgi:uncharacterized repeat protein (TIGR04138 family)